MSPSSQPGLTNPGHRGGHGKDPRTIRAADVAGKKLIWCGADTTLDEATARMMSHYIRHLLVERSGVLIGIVSARDLLGVYGADAQENPL